jgi:uncharacterized protein (DUF433 family)
VIACSPPPQQSETGAAVYIERITQNPEIMAGKPVIKGTRIPVERVLAHLAQNADLADLFAAYPELTESATWRFGRFTRAMSAWV